jgi:hypothetical protein
MSFLGNTEGILNYMIYINNMKLIVVSSYSCAQYDYRGVIWKTHAHQTQTLQSGHIDAFEKRAAIAQYEGGAQEKAGGEPRGSQASLIGCISVSEIHHMKR